MVVRDIIYQKTQKNNPFTPSAPSRGKTYRGKGLAGSARQRFPSQGVPVKNSSSRFFWQNVLHEAHGVPAKRGSGKTKNARERYVFALLRFRIFHFCHGKIRLPFSLDRHLGFQPIERLWFLWFRLTTLKRFLSKNFKLSLGDSVKCPVKTLVSQLLRIHKTPPLRLTIQ